MTDQETEIWKAGFDLHTKYGAGPKTDAEWNSLVEDCRDLYNRFGWTDFAFHMALMMVEYYSEVYKHGRPVSKWVQESIRM